MTVVNAQKLQRLFFMRSWRSLWPQMFGACVVSALVAWLSLRYSFFSLKMRLPLEDGPMIVELPLFLLVFAVLIIRPILLRYNDLYELGEHHVYTISGRVSLRRERYEIPFEDLKGVRVRQSILQRLLNVGDIILWTALADKPEVVMHGLKNPEIPLKEMRSRIDKAILDMSKRSAAWAGEKLVS